MKKFFCDRCGKEITSRQIDFTATISEQYKLTNPIKKKGYFPMYETKIREIHLCQECIMEFKKWINKKRREAGIEEEI